MNVVVRALIVTSEKMNVVVKALIVTRENECGSQGVDCDQRK